VDRVFYPIIKYSTTQLVDACIYWKLLQPNGYVIDPSTYTYSAHTIKLQGICTFV